MCAIATVSSQVGDNLGLAASPLGSLGSFGSVIAFRHTQQGSRSRWALLGTYALFSGIALSTFLSIFLQWDPSGTLLFSALSSSALIFLGFSLSAVMADRRSMLYTGGVASSILSILIWSSFVNAFFIRSSSMFSLELYAGILAFIGFVMYDTQMIIERASAGSMDIPGHSMELFMDLYALFVRIANVLLKKEVERENKKRRRTNRMQRDY